MLRAHTNAELPKAVRPPFPGSKLGSRGGRRAHTNTCHHCGRRYTPDPRAARESRYCSNAHRVAAQRIRKSSPLAALLSTARALAMQGRPLTPAIQDALDRLLPLRQKARAKEAAPAPKAPDKRLPWPRLAEDGKTPLGVDLKARYRELRPLIVARGCRVAGYDIEDIVGEVALIIARRNHMPCAFDPRKSGFAHYVNMVAHNACINLAASRKGGDDLTEDGEVHVSEEDLGEQLLGRREAIEDLIANDPDEARALLEAIDKALQARSRIRRAS